MSGFESHRIREYDLMGRDSQPGGAYSQQRIENYIGPIRFVHGKFDADASADTKEENDGADDDPRFCLCFVGSF